MKKIVALFLIVAMCFSFAACGNSNNGTTGNGTTESGITLNEYGCLTFKNDKVFHEHVKRVELNKDNWTEYFEDCEYEEHVVLKNDFGDVESEYDNMVFAFRLKEDKLILTPSVSFKFDGRTQLDAFHNDDSSLDKENSRILKFKANQATYTLYNYQTKELICENTNENVCDYYLVEFDNHYTSIHYEHYTEHTCIDVIGTIYVFDLPEDVKEDIKKAERIERDYIHINNQGGFYLEDFDKLFEE